MRKLGAICFTAEAPLVVGLNSERGLNIVGRLAVGGIG